MKFFLIAALLAMTCLSYAVGEEYEFTSDAEKQQVMGEVIKGLEKENGKKCMDELGPTFMSTAHKYLVKYSNGEPFFKQDGKERTLLQFITHSQLYKTATSEKCQKSFQKTAGKVAKYVANFFSNGFNKLKKKITKLG